ncbi:2354_t:CDS:2 [Gigaspora margarita]|uniref:2354_t:CDS:1 n=1 Tax=Gigaspora margarita TaxID=4874 RepID=A0ABN7UD21_GIGMA|nr:2354_t:CDS:2 [Gigaspora margarita]
MSGTYTISANNIIYQDNFLLIKEEAQLIVQKEINKALQLADFTEAQSQEKAYITN